MSRPAPRTPQKGLTREEKQAPSPRGQDPWRDAWDKAELSLELWPLTPRLRAFPLPVLFWRALGKRGLIVFEVGEPLNVKVTAVVSACFRQQITGLLGQHAIQQGRKRAWQVGGRTRPLAAGNPPSTAMRPGWIQQGPAQLGPGKSGTRVWPGGGTQGADRGPRWPRRRGGQPELTGTESTGECRRMTSPDTAERGGTGQEDTGS